MKTVETVLTISYSIARFSVQISDSALVKNFGNRLVEIVPVLPRRA